MRNSFEHNRLFYWGSKGWLGFHVFVLLLERGQALKETLIVDFYVIEAIRHLSAESFSLLIFFLHLSCERFLRALPKEWRDASHGVGERGRSSWCGEACEGRLRMDLIFTGITDIYSHSKGNKIMHNYKLPSNPTVLNSEEL